MKFALLLLITVGCSANDDIPAPRIASVTPERGTPTTSVIIEGDYFCQQLENEDPLLCAQIGTVRFATAAANVTLYTDTMISAEVPELTGDVRITIDVGGRLSNSVSFVVE